MGNLPTDVLNSLRDAFPPIGLIGAVLLSASLVHIFLEHLGCSRKIRPLSLLDKVWFTARVRALVRCAILISWAATVFGFAAASAVFVVFVATQLVASYIRYCLEYMISRAPIKPVANLKAARSYHRVWRKLPHLKRVRTKLLFGVDVICLVVIVAVWMVADLVGLSSVERLGAGGLCLAVLLGAIVAAAAKSGRRRSAFAKAKVPAKIEKKILSELAAFKPEVLVYFSGNPADRYQLEQWIGPINKLKQKVVIVLRENGNAAKFPKCRWPVVVARTVDQLERATVPSVKVALYVSNASKNMHLLRNEKIKHVHLNHGDSDKASSANRFCQVYDALFVAGPAGVERYRKAGFDGARPKILQIGRPQLETPSAVSANRKQGSAKSGKRATLLYAPTWEGVASSVNYSSLATLALPLIKEVGAQKDLHLIVRPHPNSGRVSAATARALAEVRRVVDQYPNVELASSKSNILKNFKQADILISDVSAVVSDFLYFDRPIIMTRPKQSTEAEFKKSFPLAAAASVVGNHNAKAVLRSVRRSFADDPTEAARRLKANEVLGNHPKGPQRAFEQAIKMVAVGLPEQKLKILLTLHTLGLGGAERDCLELSKALADRGHEVSVLARDGYLRRRLDARVTFVERPNNRVTAALEIRRLAKSFDVINTNDLHSLMALSGDQSGAKILSTIHNIGSRRNDPLARKLLQKVPDSVVFFSSSEQKRLFEGHKIIGSVISPGIQGLQRKAAKGVRAEVLLFCGRLSAERGPDRVIRAMKFLPEFKLRIVGDGPLEHDLRRLAKDLRVESRVDFVGPTADPSIEISRAGVVVVPSRRDALPRIVRESAALGKKIVATDLAGIRESAGPYRQIKYCDTDDPASFAETVATYATQKDEASKKRSRPATWKSMVNKIEQLAASHHDGRRGEARKKDQSQNIDLPKPSQDRKEQAHDGHFDGVKQVVANKKQRTRQNLAASLGQYKGEKSQDQQDKTDNKTFVPHRFQDKLEDSKVSLAYPQKFEGVPGGGEGEQWFDYQVPEGVEPFPEGGSLPAPSSQLTVGTIKEQVDLTGEYGDAGSPKITKPDKQSCAQSGADHQKGYEMMMDRKVANPPGQLGRYPSTVKSTGPVLAPCAPWERNPAEVLEAGVGNIRFEHQLDPIIDVDADPEPSRISAAKVGAETQDYTGVGLPLPLAASKPRTLIRKRNDGLFATHAAAPLAEKIVRSIETDRLKPNHVTGVATAMSFLGARLLASSSNSVKLAGVSALGAGFVLDCADGQLARLRDDHSDFGMRFDELSDRCGEMFLIGQLSRSSGNSMAGDTAALLMFTRHVLSRLESTKLSVDKDLAERPAGLEKSLRSMAQLTIGDRLVAVAVSSLASASLGTEVYRVLGGVGLAKDIAARQIRDSRSQPVAYLASVAIVASGTLFARKYPGKMPLVLLVPYTYLALKKQKQTLILD